MPSTVSGCRDASAIPVIGMDEVFDAKMPVGFTASKSRTISCFSARSSNTASMTRSTARKPE